MMSPKQIHEFALGCGFKEMKMIFNEGQVVDYTWLSDTRFILQHKGKKQITYDMSNLPQR